MADGLAVGRVAFPVPQQLQATSCGDGALPIDTALRQIAEALLRRTGQVLTITPMGGRYAQTDFVTNTGTFLEDGLLGELSRASENILTGAGIRIKHDQANEAVSDPGSYNLFMRYWPCEGDGSARLSVTMRDPDGKDVTESRNINLKTLPAELDIRPVLTPEVSGSLTVSPLLASVGTELSVLAGPPAHCDPFFFNIAPSQKLTPIPLNFFRQLELGGGRVQYEISPKSSFGIVVQESDEAGLNYLGYLCQPEQVNEMADLQQFLKEMLKRNRDDSEGLIEVDGFAPAYFKLTGFEIHR